MDVRRPTWSLRRHRRRPQPRRRLAVESLEVRTLFSASSLAAAVPADPAPLTVVSRSPPGVPDLSQLDARLPTETAGTLLGPDQVDTYSFTVGTTPGGGEL